MSPHSTDSFRVLCEADDEVDEEVDEVVIDADDEEFDFQVDSEDDEGFDEEFDFGDVGRSQFSFEFRRPLSWSRHIYYFLIYC